jgi:cytochrome d ubiquinol oxidase subunit II
MTVVTASHDGGHCREIGALVIFLLCYGGLDIGLYPYLIPHRLALQQTAAAPAPQAFLPIGTLALRPVILMYSAWSSWVFRGKARAAIGCG